MKLFRIMLCLLGLAITANAAAVDVLQFDKQTLQDIETRHAGKPFMLVLWSMDCAPCREELKTLQTARDRFPELPLVLISTDASHHRDEVQGLLKQHALADVENWIFPPDRHMAMRYAIDPGWYGELPRSYFYAADQQRMGKSGSLKLEDVEALIAMLKDQGS